LTCLVVYPSSNVATVFVLCSTLRFVSLYFAIYYSSLRRRPQVSLVVALAIKEPTMQRVSTPAPPFCFVQTGDITGISTDYILHSGKTLSNMADGNQSFSYEGKRSLNTVISPTTDSWIQRGSRLESQRRLKFLHSV
jgi:hypothetical protein